MCTGTMVDACLFSIFDNEEMKNWRDWVTRRHGMVVYTTVSKYGKELKKGSKYKSFLNERRRSGQAVLINAQEISKAQKALKNKHIQSDDEHILELALAGHVLVLCTNDNELKNDYLGILGNVGQKRRAVYPHTASRKKRAAFLDARKCLRQV